MTRIPLVLRLKKESYRRIAEAQDILVETLYNVFNDAVFHGGTAIWRCYKSNRFSDDIDFYLVKDIKKIDKFYALLKNKGFSIEKRKIGENSIYSTLKIANTLVRFEALFKKINCVLAEYEKMDGNYTTVYTLTPEELIREKVEAYLKRLKVRDLYDIFFLLRHINNISSIQKDLNKLLNNFKNPKDEKELKVLIIEGLVPSVEDIISYIKRKKGD